MAKKSENSGTGPEAKGQGEQGADENQETQQVQAAGEISKDERMWAMLCHLLGLFTSFLGPLIIWLIKREESRFVDEQGKEALNFQITVIIAAIAAGLLCIACIGFILMPAVGVIDLVFCIVAAAKANGGQNYRYPVSIRLVK